MRELNKTLGTIATIVGVVFASLYFYTSGLGVFSTESHRGLYLFFIFMLCILYYPANKKKPYSKPLYIYDAVMLVLGCSAILYWVTQYTEYAFASWDAKQYGYLLGHCYDCGFLEVTRRVMGTFLWYWGHYLLPSCILVHIWAGFSGIKVLP